MFSLKVKQVEKLDVQADNSTVLDVWIELINESGEVTEERRLNYPLDTTPGKLQEELQAFLNTYNSDKEGEAKNAELDAAHKQADEVIASFTGLELKADGSSEHAEPAAEPTETPAEETQEPQAEVAQEDAPAEEAQPEAAPTEEVQPEQPAEQPAQ